jgi:hypothetical protein
MPASEIDTSAKRRRLAAPKNPYWQSVSGGRGVSLGFAGRKKAEGVWVAKIVIDSQRIEERVRTPDDGSTVEGSFSFRRAVGTALGWGKAAGGLRSDGWRYCCRQEDSDRGARRRDLRGHSQGSRPSERFGRLSSPSI